jgi:hypothetical protein
MATLRMVDCSNSATSTFGGYRGSDLTVGRPLRSRERVSVLLVEKKKMVPTSRARFFLSGGSLVTHISMTTTTCPSPTMTAVITRFRILSLSGRANEMGQLERYDCAERF